MIFVAKYVLYFVTFVLLTTRITCLPWYCISLKTYMTSEDNVCCQYVPPKVQILHSLYVPLLQKWQDVLPLH